MFVPTQRFEIKVAHFTTEGFKILILKFSIQGFKMKISFLNLKMAIQTQKLKYEVF